MLPWGKFVTYSDTKGGSMMVAELSAFQSGTSVFVFAKMHYRTVKKNSQYGQNSDLWAFSWWLSLRSDSLRKLSEFTIFMGLFFFQSSSLWLDNIGLCTWSPQCGTIVWALFPNGWSLPFSGWTLRAFPEWSCRGDYKADTPSPLVSPSHSKPWSWGCPWRWSWV